MDVISMKIAELPIPQVRFVLNFQPYLRYIEEQIAGTKSRVYRHYLQTIAEMIRSQPQLLQPITDLDVLDQYQELIELIKITHLSQVRTDGQLYTLGIPSLRTGSISFFGYSDEFKAFYTEAGNRLELRTDLSLEDFRRNIYRELLQKGYDAYPGDTGSEVMLHLVDNGGPVRRYYKVIRRHRFVDIRMDTVLPPLRQEWIDYANGVIAGYSDLQEPLPFGQIEMEGFFVFSVLPDTEEVALTDLGEAITQIHVADQVLSYNKIKEATLSLIGKEAVEVGFLPMFKVNDKYVYHNNFSQVSIVFGRLRRHFSQQELDNVFDQLVNSANNCETAAAKQQDGFITLDEQCDTYLHIKKVLKEDGIRVMKFIPIWHKNEMLGVIELGSTDKDAVDNKVMRKIEMALPYYREYFMFKISSFNDYLQSFIMQRYTAVQDSVSWKFNEEVWKKLKHIEDGTQMISTPPVRFKDLYPYYGAIDFRNSSLKQMEAITADYKAQLYYLESLLRKHLLHKEDAAEREFMLEMRFWRNKLEASLHIDEESDLRHFLEVESMSFIRRLGEEQKLEPAVVAAYEQAANPQDGLFHSYHNQYEGSLQTLNTLLKEYLYNAERRLQQQVPHYFEKFQTDGLEYSLYAGRSISPARPFPADAESTIIQWQLDTMIGMAALAHQQRLQLPVALETTQLILVHEHKVDISYRIDERHFDVEGSYSIRYEVVKKRIDKVKLLHSSERLTQPGTIAIVYNHKMSIVPYLEKLKQLIAQGKLLPGIEYLDLEQLQGIGKLSAIRVAINQDAAGEALVVDNTISLQSL